uniref:PHD-type domain-containing protein n=1 Tax=Globisporangium ultimum (strain ATCC 200006 / CBS 805.95 / DAOM BR144) TaxID=431595 RepID=K3WLS9_GLOUD
MSAIANGSHAVHAAFGNESDTATKCCVCLEAVDYNGTVMIQCGKCAINVHVKCYGMTVPMDGSTWFCEACQYVLGKLPEPVAAASNVPRMQPRCAICPIEGGALRRTSQPGVWSHVLCINWIPELSHSLTGEMNEEVNIALLDRSRESLRCLVCGQRGGCIQCISGRCTRAFHVLCAMRSPASLIFTGYNGENQQVYHCKTHLSDVAAAKYEMIDNSWRNSPLVQDFLRANPPHDEKCRVCNNKIVPSNREAHETQCLLSWLVREEIKKRKEEMNRRGVSPVEISYSTKQKAPANGARTNGDSASKAAGRNTRADSAGKKRQHVAMRPCPDCGESVRETLMMGHLKNRCSHNKAATNRRAKNPNKSKRKTNGQAQRPVVDLTHDEPAVASDLSDVLFASWPGQNAGNPMDSTHLWKVVNGNFYSSKTLMKRRMEQLCKSTCGAKLEDIGNFTRKMARHDLLDCADTVLLERIPDDPTEALQLKAILHRCDFMMRASRTRCLEDIYAQPQMQISHISRAIEPPVTDVSQSDAEDAAAAAAAASEVRVLFLNNENSVVDCKYVMQLSKSGSQEQRPPTDGSFWSSFRHDALSTLAGPAAETTKVPIGNDDHLWLSMEFGDATDLNNLPADLLKRVAEQSVQDELTPEINLLVENLKEQMKQNRYRLRSLSKKLQLTDHYEGQSKRVASVTEEYYLEYAAWKRLCKSLFIGYKDTRLGEVKAEADAQSPDSELNSSSPSHDGEDEDDAIDDGTCVVCFDGQSPETNPIVFCDRCDLAVHQGCYGIVKLPNNEFYCDRCSIEDDGEDPGSSVFCQLCSLRDGAFKRTVDGKWVHVVCALWCPKVWIGNLQNLSDISLVAGANQGRFLDPTTEVATRIGLSKGDTQKAEDGYVVPALDQGSLCMHCKVACGRTIRCIHSGCKSSFHPLCGWFEGLPMTIRIGERGYVYNGGGAGLHFEMFCSNHLPEHYSSAERQVQRRRRRRFRIDSFYITQCKVDRAASAKQGKPDSSLLSGPIMQALISSDGKPSSNDQDGSDEWTDKAVCGACFEYSSPIVESELDVDKLHKRQFLMRCQYCNTFIHPECCISETGLPSEIFQSNWICERCILVGERAATPCMVCDSSSEYLMPCTNPIVASSAATQQQQANPAVRTLSLAPAVSGAFLNLSDKKLPAVVQQQASAIHIQQSHTIQQATNIAGVSAPYEKWVHVFCSKWMKTKTVRKNRILCAHTPDVSTDSIALRCELCLKRGRNMVNCGQCHKRFHPICAAKKKLFIAKSARQDWKFYCELHTPAGAVFDEARQSWLTTEILGQLQDLRRSLERGRMLLEMSRQRDRQQKRLLNYCKLPFMEASIEIILKKRPTPAMKEAYLSITDEVLTDTPKRHKSISSSPKPASKSRSRGGDRTESATPSRSSSRVASEVSESPATRTRKRNGASLAHIGDNSKRRRLDLEPDSPSSENGTELKKRFLDCLDRATEPSDFDEVVEQKFPEMIDE